MTKTLWLILAGSLASLIAVGSTRAQQGWSQAQKIMRAGAPATVSAIFYDGDEIWVVGADGLIARSYDDGATFNETRIGINEGLNDVYKRGDRIWVVGDRGVILRSRDEGRSFIRTSILMTGSQAGSQDATGAVDLYSVLFTDNESGHIVGDTGVILASTNGGGSWVQQKSGTDAQLFHLSFQDERGWAVGTGGVVLHTDNGGENWYPQRSGTTADLNRIYMITDRKGLITGDKGTLLITENGGATWLQAPSLNVNEPLFGISFVDKKTGWVVGYQGRIMRTYDGGLHWIEQSSGTQVDLFGVSFFKNRGYAIGRDGLVMMYYDRR